MCLGFFALLLSRKTHISQWSALTGMSSSGGYNYASSRAYMKYIGTVDIRSNLYIRPFEPMDQRIIKEVFFP